MSAQAKQFRERAKECERLAGHIEERISQIDMLLLAKDYLETANRLERLGNGGASRSSEAWW
jgi:hypothetical protein